MIERICENLDCKKTFIVKEKWVKRGWGKTCSKTCRNIVLNKKNMLKVLRYSEEGVLLEKKCSKCNKWFSIENFVNDKRQASGKSPQCKTCKTLSNRKSRIQSYNIPNDDILNLLLYQKDFLKCTICKSKDNLVIDHCHETGQYRSILCNGCNTSLGLMKEHPENIKRLALYAEYWNKRK